jgi:hypothetical protein
MQTSPTSELHTLWIQLLWVLALTQLTLDGYSQLEKRIAKLEAYVETLASVISGLEMDQ